MVYSTSQSGTRLLKHLRCLPQRWNSGGYVLLKADTAIASAMVTLGNQVYFAGNNLRTGSELWKTDGSVAGTVLVKDIAPGKGLDMCLNRHIHTG